jgi:hypothetical protein
MKFAKIVFWIAGIWGVEMGYNPNTKQFLIYAPTRDGEIYVFNSDKPEGPYQMKSLGTGLGIDPNMDILVTGDPPIRRLDAVLDGSDQLLPRDLLLGIEL